MADHSHTSSSTGARQVVVVTPEGTVRETTASVVAVPRFDGELGVAPKHSPMIGRLGYGELRIKSDAGTEEIAGRVLRASGE